MATKETHRAYKFRFYPTKEQEGNLIRTWGCVRVVYNKALDMRTTAWYEHQESIGYLETSSALTEWKKTEELSFLNDVSSIPLQQALRNLQSAFSNFWKKKAKYPRFKSLKKSKLSLRYTKAGVSIKDRKVKLAKHSEPLNIVWSRDVDLSSLISVTVSRDHSGRWFISFLVSERIEPKPVVGKTVGIDLGVKDAVVTSHGSRYNPGDMFNIKKKQEVIKKRQKALSRKVKGSKNREKARIKLARAHSKLADAKRDWLHKTTTKLVEQFDVICIEDLNVSGMTTAVKGKGRSAKAGLNRGIMAHNFGEFRELLEYKVDWYGKEVVAIDRFYPSSKRCNQCGKINQNLKLQHRHWTCGCGV